MTGTVLAWDVRLFHLLNSVWTCALLDRLMPAVSALNRSPVVVFGLLPAAAGFWIARRRRAAAPAMLAVFLCVGAADILAYRVFKPLFHRPRPEFSGIAVVLREAPHGHDGFPSNHAANAFAAAVFLGALYPALRLPLLLAAMLVAYSRVYVGAHFPLDAAGGAILGAAIGWLGAKVYREWRARRTAGA